MKDKNLKPIFNYAYLISIVFLCVSILFMILVNNSDGFIELAYIIMIIVTLCITISVFMFALNIRKRNQIMKNLVLFFEELEDFEGLLNNILKDQDAYKYDQLFLKSDDRNNHFSMYGDKFMTILADYNLDSNNLFEAWYQQPETFMYFKEGYLVLLNDLRKLNQPIPLELKKLTNK